MADWGHALSRRARKRTDASITAILAGVPEGVLALTGGFPNPATFPADIVEDLAGRLLRDDPAVALQYAPSEGLPSVRAYLRERQEQLQGTRPEGDELIVTSGGMECLTLMAQAIVDPGDTVLVEEPTYLGALLAFRGAGAAVEAVPTDEDGLIVEALAERLDRGPAPKLLYVIPDFQNPSGRTLSADRREVLVELCAHHGVLVLEDVAYREIAFDGSALPSLWSLAPGSVVQAGTFSKVFAPGVRLGWAAGPAAVVGQLAAAKQTTDQCAGALGQRLVEEYGRAGHFEQRLPAARELYGAHWRATETALREHLPAGCRWSVPAGGFFTWLTLPEQVDAVAMRGAAVDAGVAYVAGTPFGAAPNTLRLSFSYLSVEELGEAVRRLGGVVADTMAASRV